MAPAGPPRPRPARGPCARASSPRAAAGASRPSCAARSPAPAALLEQLVRHLVAARAGRAPGIRDADSPSTNTWSNSRPLAACIVITCTAGALGAAGDLLLAQPRLGHGGQVAGEVARGGLRLAAHVGGGQLAAAWRCCAAARPCPPGWRTPAGGADRCARSAAARTRPGGGPRMRSTPSGRGAGTRCARSRPSCESCGPSQRGRDRRRHVELAPARQLREPRDVHRAQLDRRPRAAPAPPRRSRPGRRAARSQASTSRTSARWK